MEYDWEAFKEPLIPLFYWKSEDKAREVSVEMRGCGVSGRARMGCGVLTTEEVGSLQGSGLQLL